MSFFFSSRRRHTRYIGDWSSDVCSSDLSEAVGGAIAVLAGGAPAGGGSSPPAGLTVRSEERRVGKEGRSRGRRYHRKQKRRKTTNITRPISYTTTLDSAQRRCTTQRRSK